MTFRLPINIINHRQVKGTLLMELSYLVKIRKGSMESFTLNNKTPKEVQEDHDLSTRWYLILHDVDQNKDIAIDLSLIYVETSLNKCVTWEELASQLTDSIIIAYTTILPSSDSKNLIYTYLLNTDDFELSYCNMLTPEDRNISTFRWRMPDLVVTKTNPKNTTNFHNCLCCINGIVSKPSVFKDELFIKDGARYFTSTTERHYPSVVLMDFSELGDIEILPIKDCSIKYLNHSGAKSAISDMKLYLPQEYDLTNKTVFPVIAHSLFFPSDISISSNKSIIISPYKLPIRTSLLKLNQHIDHRLDNTDILYLDSTVDKYIIEDMLNTDWYGNFLVIVDTPKVLITKTHAVRYASSTHSTIEPDGVLFDQATQSFYDYVKVPYDSLIDIYTTRRNKNYELDIPLTKPQYSLLSWDCVHNEPLYNIHGEDFYVVNIFSI